MINTKELRIGNAVLSNGVTRVVKSIEVDSVSFNVDYEDDLWHCVDLDCDAIMITEGHILSLGLKKWKNKKIWSLKGFIIYFKKGTGFCFGRASFRTHVKSVHQLQNLYFAITQKELIYNE